LLHLQIPSRTRPSTSGPPLTPQSIFVFLPDMGLPEDFDDRHIEIESAAEPYHPYEYQTENNGSWAGALPVKQYVAVAYATQLLLLKC